jgi:hypothetical protein
MTIWDRLRPLGAQWGSDPGTFPAVPKEKSQPLRETVLAPIDIPEHYGCQKRLAGVVDQANSSCVSCHMAAYAAPSPYLNMQGTGAASRETVIDSAAIPATRSRGRRRDAGAMVTPPGVLESYIVVDPRRHEGRD